MGNGNALTKEGIGCGRQRFLELYGALQQMWIFLELCLAAVSWVYQVQLAILDKIVLVAAQQEAGLESRMQKRRPLTLSSV